MNCDDCQSRICELLDAGQSTRPDSIIEQHLAGCPACREFHSTWAALDAHLIRGTAAAALPPDFQTTLLSRLPALPPRLTPVEIATRSAQYEHEYREAIAALGRRYLFPDTVAVLRLLAMAGAGAFAGTLLAVAIRALPLAIAATLSRPAAGPGILCGLISLAGALYGLRRAFLPTLRPLFLLASRCFPQVSPFARASRAP